MMISLRRTPLPSRTNWNVDIGEYVVSSDDFAFIDDETLRIRSRGSEC